MPVLSKGNTFATNQQVTATNLNNLVDNATFVSGAADNTSTVVSGGAITVKDAGISTAKLADNAVTTAKLATGVVNGLTTVTAANGDSIAIADVSDSGNVKKALISDLYGSAFAGQLAFPATKNASSNANTLDDYEEGTWTPSLGGTATYTTQAGRYTKIGRFVHVTGRLAVNSIGTGSTGTISGLPFTAGSDAGVAIGYFQNIATTGYVSVCAHVVSGGTTIQTGGLASGGDGVTSPANFFKDSTEVIFSATYTV